jgi:hypothetical protein
MNKMVKEEYVKWAKSAVLLNTNYGLMDYNLKELEKVLGENYSLELNEIEECIKYLEETEFMHVEKQTIKLIFK